MRQRYMRILISLSVCLFICYTLAFESFNPIFSIFNIMLWTIEYSEICLNLTLKKLNFVYSRPSCQFKCILNLAKQNSCSNQANSTVWKGFRLDKFPFRYLECFVLYVFSRVEGPGSCVIKNLKLTSSS